MGVGDKCTFLEFVKKCFLGIKMKMVFCQTWGRGQSKFDIFKTFGFFLKASLKPVKKLQL